MLGFGATGGSATGSGASYYYDSGFNPAWAVGVNEIIGTRVMKKNVGGQVVGCAMVSATDGSAFTGSVTVYVTGDGGTQAVGSVSSGACTHEGNGFHTYAPAQAETNYDHVAFTFIGSGAVPSSVQVYPNFPQTGDSFARIGAAGAGLTDLATAANLATVAGYLDTEIAAILADTNELQTDWANGGRLDLILDARASQTSVDDLPTNAELATALSAADDAMLAAIATVNTVVDAILVDTGTDIPATLATIGAYIDTEVAAIKAKTDNLPAAPAATGDIPTATQNADALLNRDMSAVSDTNARSPLNALRFLRNKFAVVGTTLTVKKEDDSTTAWTATVTTDAAADPITGSDPG